MRGFLLHVIHSVGFTQSSIVPGTLLGIWKAKLISLAERKREPWKQTTRINFDKYFEVILQHVVETQKTKTP